MTVITWIGTAWLVVSIPVSIVLGFLLKGDERELLGVEGGAAVYRLPDGTVARAPLPAAAA